MTTKNSKRKTAAEFAAEHELFLVMIAEKRPELEIMKALGLSSTVQLKSHTLMALKKGEVTPNDLIPEYEAVFAKSLPAVIRKQMSLDSEKDAEALVKIESQGNVVMLTLLLLSDQDEALADGTGAEDESA